MLNEIIFLLTILVEFTLVGIASRLGKEYLYASIIVNVLLISSLGAKVVPLFGFVTNVGNVFFAAVFLATHILVERYGKKFGYVVAWMGFISTAFFVALSQFVVRFVPILERIDISDAITVVFQSVPRVALASMVGFVVVQYVNVWLFDFIKIKTNGKHLWFRDNVSNFFGQLLDSILFFTIAFYGVLSNEQLIQSILIGFSVKFLIGVLGTPVLYLSKQIGGESMIAEIEETHARLTKTLKDRTEALIVAQHIAKIGSWEWDLKTNKVSWSPEMYRIYGYGASEFLVDFDKAMERVHPDDVPKIKENLELDFKKFKAPEWVASGIDFRILFDGRVRYLHGEGKIIAGEDGLPGRMVGTVQDVTEQTQIREALSAAQTIAKMGSWEWDIKNDKVVWSDELFRIYGYKPQEFGVNYQKFLDSVHPLDKERVDEIIKQSFEEKKSFSFVHRIIRPDGAVRTLQALGDVELDSAGSPVKMSGTGQDITEQVKSQEDLNALLEALNKSSIVSATDVKGDIYYANDKFIEISKYSREELLGQNHRIIKSGFHPPSFYKNLWDTISSGRVWHGEIKNKAKDGSYYWVDTSIAPILDSAGKPQRFIAVRTLITERKFAEEALKKRSTEVERLNSFMVDREVLMVELKKENEKLRKKIEIYEKR